MAEDDELNVEGNWDSNDPAGLIEKRAIKTFVLDGHKRGDGNVVQMGEVQLGVLQKMATAPKSEKDLLQVLLLTRFGNKTERQRAVNLIGWMQRHDVPMDLVIVDLVARCAEGGQAREDLKEALTHMTLTNVNRSMNKRDGSNPRSSLR
jgi:hypothetical protein